MTSATIRKQFDDYLPLLSDKQQLLLLEVIKAFLNIDEKTKRITQKQYNNEINAAVTRIEEGHFVIHRDVLKELSKW